MIDLSQYPTWTLPSSVTECQARGCRARADGDEATPAVPRKPAPGGDLCSVHVARFGDLVGQVAKLLPDLEHNLTRRQSGPAGGGGGRSSGVRDIATLWNPQVARVLWEVREWTQFVVRTVQRERPLKDRDDAEGLLDEMRELAHWWKTSRDAMSDADMARLALLMKHRDGIITRAGASWQFERGVGVRATRINLTAIAAQHADWLGRFPTLGIALYEDAARHRNAAVQALHSDGVRRRALAHQFCQEDLGVDEVGRPLLCYGQLVVVITEPGEGEPSTILCEENPAHKQMHREDWLDLVVREQVQG